MSPITALLNRVSACVFMVAFAQQAAAAVLILEGAPQSSSAPPPALSTPANPAPREAPPAAAPAAPSRLPAPGESGLTPAAAPAVPVPPAAAIVPQAPPAAAIAPQAPPLPARPPAVHADPGAAKVENSAEVSIEMIPGQTVSVGSVVSFRVTSKKAGYLVLVDVDTTGRLTQIYPNTASLTRTSRVNANYIKPGATMTVPLATDPYAGVQYIVSPPNGQALIVAILSAQPVQILDLPDVPVDTTDKAAVLAYLAKWMSELRIPDEGSQLREAKWSFNAKSYTIQ